MVAGEVEVVSRRAGAGEAWRWRSKAGEGFTVEEVALQEAPARGTVVRLHLTDEAKEFLEPARIERIVRTYSGHVPVPLTLIEVKDGQRGEPRAIGDSNAIWRLPRAEVTEEAYQDFYGHVAGQFDTPALTIHYRAEGRHEYSVLLFLPSMPPLDLFDPERHGRLRLYVRRVFITDQAALLPGYLRFMRGVIDSEDMPLNISREMLQNNPLVAQIRKAVTNRVLSELKKFAEKDAEAYRAFWDNFGAVLKEGLYEDAERRDDLYALSRFATTSAPEGGRGLADYVAGMNDNQTAIYYLTGENVRQLEASPQLEGFRARGIEVLLLTDPIDSFWTAAAMGYEGKPFRSVAQGSADLEAIPLADEGKEETPPAAAAELATLIAALKQTLGEAVSDVVASQRLTESACCLVAPAGGPDRRLEKLLARQGGGQLSAPVLEINPRHALVRSLAEKAAAGGHAGDMADAAWLLFDSARIAEGESPQDPAAFCARLNDLMTRGLGGGKAG
jgi:molecular chaperone HtpG